MTPNTVTYTRRLPAEQYGFMEMTATATISEDESAHEAFMSLKEEVEKAITGQAMEAVEKEEPTPEPKKRAGKKAKAVVEEEEEVTTEDTPDDDEGEAVTTAKRKTTKSKATVYSRASDTHKSMFAEVLAEVAPTWKTTEAGKAKAKKLSQTLDGTDFLDENGDTMPSFITAIKKGMK
jgi:hypothetical protein